jgi:predicted Zn-dependent protease with MMP-like domain
MHGGFKRRPSRQRGVRCTRWRFERLVREACEGLPVRFQLLLRNVAVTVEDKPLSDLIGDPEGGPLGLYQGTPLGERGTGYNLVLPDKITIYRRPLLATCHSQNELRDEIELTVLHEVGHFFGITDRDLPF